MRSDLIENAALIEAQLLKSEGYINLAATADYKTKKLHYFITTMMKLTMAVFALLSMANGIQTKEDNIQQLPEVESEADTSEIEDKKF